MNLPCKPGILLFLSLISFTIFVQAQTKCGCPEYYTSRKEYEKKGGNSSNSYIEKLHVSTNAICVGKSYEWKAMDYRDEQKWDTAEIYFKKAEKIYQQSACSDSISLNAYKQWAEMYYRKGEFAKAQEYSFKLLRSSEALGSAYETAICLTMIAQLFNQTNQAEKGVLYTRQAATYIDKIENPLHKVDLFFKLSKRYLWHYQDTKTKSSLDSSELFSNQQLSIAKSINKKRSIAAAFNNLQGVAYEREDYKNALRYLDSSFRYTDSDNYSLLATNYYDKADILIELKDYKEAERMADSCLFYYREETGNPAYIAEAYEILSRIAKANNDYRKGYEYNEKARQITDSIRNIESTKQVTELEKKYNQAKNEQTIKDLAQQKRLYLLASLTGLLALAGMVFFFRQQSLKNKQVILETEQRLNRARINPHFFFNALSSLQSFILQGRDAKLVASNISRFSHIMRETLESTYKEYITIEKEIDFLTEYLELQKIRFPGKFEYEIIIAKTIEPEDILIPSMILQPFAENSIEHGFQGIEYTGEIIIRFNNTGRSLSISLTDNGKGFQFQEKKNGTHVSRAGQIIKDRIYILNSRLKTQASFSITENENAKGVTIQVELPLLYKDSTNTILLETALI